MPSYARVVVESPLPQLDRLFDYLIPDDLQPSALAGVRVRVPFGRGASLLGGFIVEVTETTDFAGKVASLAEVVSPIAVLTRSVYELCRAVADRQAATIGDLLKLAVPPRAVAVEKKWLKTEVEPIPVESGSADGTPDEDARLQEFFPAEHDLFIPVDSKRVAITVAPRTVLGNSGFELPSWVLTLLRLAKEQLDLDKSAIILVPDFRDLNLLLVAAEQLGLADAMANFSAQQSKPARYGHFLQTLDQTPKIIIGTRSAIYAPAANLGAILIWDDGDSSHIEPTSPYIHSREVALIRQQHSDCVLVLAAHARSCETQRLIELDYFQDATAPFRSPKIAISETDARVDGLAWRTIRTGIEQGAVLVQVAARGQSVSAYCRDCGERSRCKHCNGPLWVDESNTPKCRWCNAINLGHRCSVCASSALRPGRAGATRTVAEFGRAFPGAFVLESNGDNRLEYIEPGRRIVIATAGAEPRVPGGYAAVILLDCGELLARDSLKATEEAVRVWSNAVALLGPGGSAVAVGLSGSLGQSFALWNQAELAAAELASRRELHFPPAVRLASLSGPLDLLDRVLQPLREQTGIEILGPLPIQNQVSITEEWRYLIRYPYALGSELADQVKALVALTSAGQTRVSAKSGRNSRPIRVKMDEPEVI